MTVQAADYINYNGKKYTLIDMEYDKDMSEELVQWDHGNLAKIESSACWRGYIAEYWIIDNTLYGKKIYDDDHHESFFDHKIRVHYTGGCIIAFDDKDDFQISDFLVCYLDYSEALELHFTDGILDDINDLSDVGKMYRTAWENGTIERDETGRITLDGSKMRDQIARKNLNYAYGSSTYRWR